MFKYFRNNRFDQIIKLFLPLGLIKFHEKFLEYKKKLKFYKEIYPIVKENIVFKDKHNGERCFIIGTGPSINNQNLAYLKNELCFSLNLFYLSKQYQLIKPRYHVFSGLFNHPHIAREHAINFYNEMQEYLTAKNFFTDYRDSFVIKKNLFKNTHINYVNYEKRLDLIFCDGVDLTMPTFYVSNVAIQALLIAIYMGFKKIYLLGLDHNFIQLFLDEYTKEHFYDHKDSVLYNDNKFIDACDKRNFSTLLEYTATVWNQYKKIKRFCDDRKIKIYNATNGGILDVFPIVKYDSLF